MTTETKTSSKVNATEVKGKPTSKETKDNATESKSGLTERQRAVLVPKEA